MQLDHTVLTLRMIAAELDAAPAVAAAVRPLIADGEMAPAISIARANAASALAAALQVAAGDFPGAIETLDQVLGEGAPAGMLVEQRHACAAMVGAEYRGAPSVNAAFWRTVARDPRLPSAGPADELLRRALPGGFEVLAANAGRALDYLLSGAGLLSDASPGWWDGKCARSLLVVNALGDGEALMFGRYFAAAAERCDELVVAVQPALVPLLRQNGVNAMSIFALGDLVRGAAAVAEVQQLPALLGMSCGDAQWLAQPSRHDFGLGTHVGVNWAASQGTGRSVEVARLEPLAAVTGVTFHNLTFGHRALGAPKWLRPLAVGDYAQTATLLAGLDLVLTVDTSTANLAGALGLPCWVALPGGDGNWRWGEGDHTPWFPHARVFRGPRAIATMAATLAAGIR